MSASAALATRRAEALARAFAHIAATRMAGIPILHPQLQVQAIGFAPQAGGGALGVLVTPWFMNLVWLPLDEGDIAAAGGVARTRIVGGERFAFLGAHEPGFGAFEACSLFSPMHEFVDQAAAQATAEAVLAQLRADDAARPADGARRALLFGRRAESPA